MTTTSENVIASAKAGDTSNWQPTADLCFKKDSTTGRLLLHQRWWDYVSGKTEWRGVPVVED